jgi:hypothetical protein
LSSQDVSVLVDSGWEASPKGHETLAIEEVVMRLSIIAASIGICAGCVGEVPGQASQQDASTSGSVDAPAVVVDAPTTTFSFFITSTGGPTGGDFRRTAADLDGLAGADELCQTRATAGVPASASKTWRAYLSTATVNARDRIGTGPWFNRNGTMVAASVDALHTPAMNLIDGTTGLDETGAQVPIASPNQHDILTGSNAQGMATASTCNNWTSSAANGVGGQVGHHNRAGGGADPTSWNAAHATNGCSAAAFVSTGGRGSIYCFAIN